MMDPRSFEHPVRLGPWRRALLSCATLALGSCATTRPPDTGQVVRVRTGSAEIAMRVGGAGAPAIVLESNMRDDLSIWDPLFDSLAQLGSTVAYSRVGYGQSEWRGETTVGTRTPIDVARTLRHALDVAGVHPPFLLIGHSMGAIYAMQFAKEYVEEVAGLLLVDGAVPTYYRECERVGLESCRPPPTLLRLAPEHVRAELLGLVLGEPDLPGPDDLRGFPVTLITASDPPPLLPGDQADLWRRVQRGFVERIEDARVTHAEGSGHYVHRDRPDVVLAEVRRLLEAGPSRSVLPGRRD